MHPLNEWTVSPLKRRALRIVAGAKARRSSIQGLRCIVCNAGENLIDQRERSLAEDSMHVTPGSGTGASDWPRLFDRRMSAAP